LCKSIFLAAELGLCRIC